MSDSRSTTRELESFVSSSTIAASVTASTVPPRRSRVGRNATAVGIAFLILGALALLTALALYDDRITGSICGDGWESSSTGTGRCSNHDSVAYNLFDDTPFGVSPDSWLNVSRWGLGLFGLVDVGIGTGLVLLGRRRRERGATAARINHAPAHVGTLELTARIRDTGTGRTVAVSVDGGSVTSVPFFYRDVEGRAARQLADLMATTNKRRIGRRGRTAVEAYGTELFNALLPEPARSRYREARAVALQTDSRLRLLLDLDDRSGDLPWEYLFDAERSSFLAMSQDTSVVRVVNDGHQTRATEPIDQLRLLIMVASPRGLAPLHSAEETRRISEGLAESGAAVVVREVQGDTLDDLRRTLTEFEPHIFHFVGHGHWDDELDDGAVAFADDQGGRQAVSGRDLGVILNRPDLRLVLFNSCDAARTSKRDRFAGVAGSLVAQGVPAAIGMQYPIEDRSASAFGSEFLAALVGTQSIDDALTEARTAIYTSRSVVEWGTPVLTSRVAVDDIIQWASKAPRGR